MLHWAFLLQTYAIYTFLSFKMASRSYHDIDIAHFNTLFIFTPFGVVLLKRHAIRISC